jgi:hypothetical protein
MASATGESKSERATVPVKTIEYDYTKSVGGRVIRKRLQFVLSHGVVKDLKLTGYEPPKEMQDVVQLMLDIGRGLNKSISKKEPNRADILGPGLIRFQEGSVKTAQGQDTTDWDELLAQYRLLYWDPFHAHNKDSP